MKCPSNVPDFSLWEKYKAKKKVFIEGLGIVPEIRADFSQQGIGDRLLSAGIFKDKKGRVLYCAWGFKDEPHCSFTAVMGARGKWLTPMRGCPQVKRLLRGSETVGISIQNGSHRKKFLFDS